MKIALIFTLALITGLATLWTLYYYTPLRTCAKSNNVYQCKYVALPEKIPGMSLLEEDE